MRNACGRILTFIILIGFSTETLWAQGSGFRSDFRLIQFDAPRILCLSDGASLFSAPGQPMGNAGPRASYSATAISLDQDWIQIEIAGNQALVRPHQASFGAC